MKLDGRTIAKATGGELRRDAPPGPIWTDTRTLPEDAWFLALIGPRFDGHSFVPSLRSTGCIVSQHLPYDGGLVHVRDTERALQDLGRYARNQLPLVVGLTGSAGKTTTRALAALALEQLGPVHQTRGNLNNHLGVPLSLLDAPEDCQAAVIELGTSSPGEIALLADIARPHVRMLINVGPAHLEELGGIEGVAREKGALFTSAGPEDLLIYNADDPLVAAIERPSRRAVSWGRAAEADVRLLDAVVDRALRTQTTVSARGEKLCFSLPTPGIHVAHNAAGALALAMALGLDLERAAASLERYEPVGMRLRVEPIPVVGGEAIAINDAYNANPTSMAASLRMLAGLDGRRVAVLGDMLELGADEVRWHADIATLALSLELDLVILVGDRMALACTDGRAWSAVDPADLLTPLQQWLRPGDRVLFKGSRGARVERILHSLQRGDF